MPSWRRSKSGSNEKLHLENARQLRGIYFIDLEDKELKETIKNARNKLETSIAPAMPCKIMKKTCGSGASHKIKNKTCVYSGSWWNYKTAYGRIIAKSSWRPYCRKRKQFIATLFWCTNLFLCVKLWKIPAAKAAADKEWEKLGKISAWNLTKVRSKKEVIDEARTSGAKVHFASLMDICHLKKCWIGGKTPKVQKSGCTPRWYCERRFWVLRSIHRTRIFSISNGSS